MSLRFKCGLLVALAVGCGGKGETHPGDGAGSGGGGGGAAGLGGVSVVAGSSGAGRGGAASGSAGATVGGAGGGVAGTSSGGASGGSATAGGGSGGATAGTGSGGGAEAVKLLEPTVNAFCAAARSCCAKQGEPAMLDACESMFPMNNETVASLASGAATLDPAALALCRAAYEKAATSCDENPVLAACRGVVIGARAEGAPCTSGSECAGSPGPYSCHITTQGGTVGVCKKVPHATSGGACNFTCRSGETCTFTIYGAADSVLALCFEDEGFYCDSASSVCKPLLALGAACSSDDECGYKAFCSTTCKKRGVEGEACAPCVSSLTCVNDKCVSPPFASGNTCEGRSLGPY